MLLLVTLHAWAAPEPEGPAQHVSDLPRVASVAERLDEAWQRVALGDPVGARLMFEALLRGDLDPDVQVEVRYGLATTLEAQGLTEEALAAYAAVVQLDPHGSRALDARFRAGITLAAASRYEDALRSLRELGRPGRLPEPGPQQVEILSRAWQLARTGSPGALRRLDKALRGRTEASLAWPLSQAEAIALRHAVDEAAGLGLDVPEARLTRQLQRRAGWILQAETRLGRLVALGDSQFILTGLLQLGSAHVQLGEDLLAAPPPARLSATEQQRYRDEVRNKALVQLVKARNYFDLGLEHAGRVVWSGAPRPALEASMRAVTARIEAIDAAP